MARDLKIPESRHPEKAHRADNAQPKKPSWIRVSIDLTTAGFPGPKKVFNGEHGYFNLIENNILSPGFVHNAAQSNIARISNMYRDAPRFRNEVDILV